jgi:precorrin-6A/cobalt-precorrin-6A reductase
MRAEPILILGGTGDARRIAELLVAKGARVITSLAGVTSEPVLPPGEVRRGGFGGVEGLVSYLRENGIAAVIDATHPFAAQMSIQAYTACQQCGIPLYRLERPGWTPQLGDSWTEVASAQAAAGALPAGAQAMVTIGRKEIRPFFARADIAGVARMIEPPSEPAPRGWQVLLQRPPFTHASEIELMRVHRITHLVTKNAGGLETEAKLSAARQLVIPVIMIARPAKPQVRCAKDETTLMGLLLREHYP